MPYLFYLFCDDCGEGFNLDIDVVSTLEAYQEDEGRKITYLTQSTVIWDYIIYSCTGCPRKYKYTYKDVERKVREHFCSLSERHRGYYEALAEQQKLEEQKSKDKQKSSPDAIERIKTRYTHRDK